MSKQHHYHVKTGDVGPSVGEKENYEALRPLVEKGDIYIVKSVGRNTYFTIHAKPSAHVLLTVMSCPIKSCEGDLDPLVHKYSFSLAVGGDSRMRELLRNAHTIVLSTAEYEGPETTDVKQTPDQPPSLGR